MLGGKTLKTAGLVVLVFFSWFTLTADLAWAGQQVEEDELLKARRLYQDGDYEGSIQVLDNFISKLKAIVAQKKNVAEAFYLLAKVYYTVGEDQKVDENLRKVFETYPAFEHREVDVAFSQRVERARAEVKAAEAEAEVPVEEEVVPEPETTPPPADNGVIVAPAKKKKKKFPVVLVLGGVALAALLAVLLSGGSGKEDNPRVGTVTRVKVRASIVYAGQNLTTNHKTFINNDLKLFQTVRFTDHFNANAEYEDLQKKSVTLFFEGGLGSYQIKHEVGPAWTKPYPGEFFMIGTTVYNLDVVEYDFEGGTDPGMPKLSEDVLYFSVKPDENDPSAEWYRIETQTLRILSPSSTVGQTGEIQGMSKKKVASSKR